MNPERWGELKELVGSALEVPAAEREAFVRERASRDPELCDEALSLLARVSVADGFLSAPAIEAAQSILESVLKQRRGPILAGALFGPYEIVALIGAGSMGEVYRARDERLERDVAIKVLPSLFTQDPDRLRRFEQEARAAGGLNHPNILAIYDVGSKEGAPYVVSELLEGETLRARLASGALSSRKAIDYAVQVARGLAAAHEKGIVHRDLKPENLFVTKDGRVKILDFGLAKVTRPESDLANVSALPTETPGTEPGMVMGTVGYMSPEQVKGEPADARSDIFSLGAILYEMLSGKRAFRGETAAETMAAILKEDPPELSVTGKNIAPGIDRIVRHCLEKTPEERFHSARDLAFDLESQSGSSEKTAAVGAPARRRFLRLPVAALGAMALALLAAGALTGLWLASRRSKTAIPSFHRLTFRRGDVFNARFAPDGRTIVYAAKWEAAPTEIFTVRTDSTESRPVGLAAANLLAVSSRGELAVLLTKDASSPYYAPGTLARISLGGGTPREVAEDIVSADWAPDGEELAVVRRMPNGKHRLEYPIGTPLYEGPIRSVRVSPKGDLVALLEVDDNVTYQTASTIDRKGKRTIVAGGWNYVGDLLWSPRGDELIINAGRSTFESAILAVSLSGRERVLISNTSGLSLDDVSLDGRLLVEQSAGRQGILCQRRGENHERELAWLDSSMVLGISKDGSAILFAEYAREPPPKGGVYLRRTDGSPAVRLGDGVAENLSPDGRWVLATTGEPAAGLVLLPTGAGTARKIPTDGLKPIDAFRIPDDKGFLFSAQQEGVVDLFVVGSESGTPRRLHAEGLVRDARAAVSPDGESFIFCSRGGLLKMAALAGGEARTVSGPPLEDGGVLIQWSEDGRYVYLVRRRGDVPTLVDRLELATGRRELWKRLSPEDPTGVRFINPVRIAADGQSYAYTYFRTVASDLYVVEGIH